jgi:tetratricopeptide (TPR) repeat protein
MKQIWQDMLHTLKSQDFTAAGSYEIAGKLELMLIRLQAEPDPEQAEIASDCMDQIPPELLDIPQYIICYLRTGRIQIALGNFDRAVTLFEKAARHSESFSKLPLAAIAYMELGELARLRGQLLEATRYQERALHLSNTCDLDREQADALNNLANIAIEKGDLDKAEILLMDSLDRAEILDETRLEGHIYNNLGVIKCLRAAFDEAISYYTRSIPKREQAGDTKGLAETYHNLGLAYMDSGNFEKAMTYTRKALDKAHETNDRLLETRILLSMAELSFHDGDYLYALSMAHHLTANQNKMGDHPGIAETTKLIGKINLERGDLDQAEEHLSIACSMFKSLEILPGEAESLKYLAFCQSRKNRRTEARELLAKARVLYEQIGNTSEIQSIETLIRQTEPV